MNPNAYWEYVVAVALDNANQDVDLYVSAIDARFPTSEDYDFMSNDLGADNVYIRSDSDFWETTGYNKAFGIVFVVGVKALTDNANYTLMMTGPSRYEVNYTNLSSSWVQKTFPVGNSDRNNFHVYKWFNWGHRDFRVTIDINDGAIQGYVNTYSERSFQQNGYLAIPINANNSKWWSSGIT